MLRAIIVAAVVAAVWLAGAAPATAWQATGVVRGVIYWDRDGDGDRDADEPGLPALVSLVDASAPASGPLASGRTDDDSAYTIEHAPGTYRLDPGVEHRTGVCVDGVLSYNPFPVSRCWSIEFPITSPEYSEPFDLAAGETITADFGVTTLDQMALLLRAIEETGFAAPGSVVRATSGGTVCGEATVPADEGGIPGESSFSLYVDGASRKAGCPREGDLFELELDGKTERHAFPYVPFAPRLNPLSGVVREGMQIIDAVFAENYAWYWSDGVYTRDARPFAAGTRVTATVDGVVCGETAIGDVPGVAGPLAPESGFGRLFVPSARISTGCGREGATVRIIVGGEEVANFPWEPGLTGFGGPLPTPSLVVSPPLTPVSPPAGLQPPDTGTGGFVADGVRPAVPAAAAVVFGIVAAATIAAAAQRRAR